METLYQPLPGPMMQKERNCLKPYRTETSRVRQRSIHTMPLAELHPYNILTKGSDTLWKGYGNRYFTASAKVMFSLGSATLKLRNHYTLSSKGIDERYGVESFIASTSNGSVSATDPVITDATARTVGASDVNMECKFTLKYSDEYGYSMKKQYIMESAVGFVDIDKADEQVKVKQSWTLTKI